MFGFFKKRGDLIITPEKYNYHPGETLKGVLKVAPKEPIQASKLSVTLTGKEFVTHRSSFNASTNRNTQRSETDVYTIYEFDPPLDGERSYTEAEYPFEINIPAEIQPQQPSSIVPEVLTGTLSAFGVSMGRRADVVRTEWTLSAQLDIPDALDMRKHIQINIG